MAPDPRERKKGIGDLLDTVNGLLDLANRLQERGEEGINRSGEFKTDRGVTARYGVQIKTAAGGGTSKDRTEAGEVIPPSPPDVMQEQAPVDVIQDGDEVTVIAEISGVTDQSLGISVEGQELILMASRRGTRFEQRVRLPFTVVPEPLTRTYNNGLFTLIFRRAN